VLLELTGTLRSCSFSLPASDAEGGQEQPDTRVLDEFDLLMPELGQLVELRLWTEAAAGAGSSGNGGGGGDAASAGDPGVGGAWYLWTVEVAHGGSGCRWLFELDTWVHGGREHAVTAPAQLVAGTLPENWASSLPPSGSSPPPGSLAPPGRQEGREGMGPTSRQPLDGLQGRQRSKEERAEGPWPSRARQSAG
jgi:hypothetical protein